MAQQKTIQHFLKGEAIITEGSPGDRSYRILSGEVLVCKENDQNQLVPIARLGADDFFGEMYLFETSGRRSATVVAASTEVKVEVFFREDMETILGPINPTLGKLLEGYQRRLKTTSGACAEMSKGISLSKLPDGSLKTTERHNGFSLRRELQQE